MAIDDFIQVPPDSTGKKLHTKRHTVGVNEVQVQSFHLSDGISPENTQTIDRRGAAAVRFTEGQPILNGYGALKTEVEKQLGVYEGSLDSYDALFYTEVANGGQSTYNPEQSSTILGTTTASGSRVTRTTNRYHYYLPGTSNLARISVSCGDTGKANNVRRWGVYDDSDGIYFELNGTEIRVIIRGSTSGTVVNIPIPRSTWSEDKLDGTGISEFNLDITKVNNFWADYSFSGAGRVRFGVYEPNGNRLVAHIIYTANLFAYPIIRSGTLPFRVENINTGSTGSSSELREVAMSISMEGDPKDYTFWRSADMEVYGVTATTDTHLISMQSIPLINGKHNSVQAYPETLNVVVEGGSVAINIYQTTELTGASWSVGGDSSILGSTTGTLNLTGAKRFHTMFLGAGAHYIDVTRLFELNDEGIMCQANGVGEIWSLTATKLSGATVTVGCNLAYRELW
jgi:hypothetical protein